jgi:hypothetical protein
MMRAALRSRWLPALLTFILPLVLLLPQLGHIAPFFDEDQYGWSAAYFGGRLAHLDFSPGDGSYGDPGWSPTSYWALTQPMGTRFVYAIALASSGNSGPAQALDETGRGFDPDVSTLPADATLTPAARQAMRTAAVLCTAMGLACVAWRLRWAGMLASALFLALPVAARNCTLGYAEAPLLLGIGLVVLTYGTRWLPLALGLVASFKLTGLGLWPLVLIPGALGARGWRPVVLGMLATLAVWTLLEPVSWFAGGPLYLLPMLGDRVHEYLWQSRMAHAQGGTFLPVRYVLPFWFGLLLLTVQRATATIRHIATTAKAMPAEVGGDDVGGTLVSTMTPRS